MDPFNIKVYKSQNDGINTANYQSLTQTERSNLKHEIVRFHDSICFRYIGTNCNICNQFPSTEEEVYPFSSSLTQLAAFVLIT